MLSEWRTTDSSRRDYGSCYAQVATIAKKARMHRDTVTRCLAYLESLRIISRDGVKIDLLGTYPDRSISIVESRKKPNPGEHTQPKKPASAANIPSPPDLAQIVPAYRDLLRTVRHVTTTPDGLGGVVYHYHSEFDATAAEAAVNQRLKGAQVCIHYGDALRVFAR